jgi:hypothetical protein
VDREIKAIKLSLRVMCSHKAEFAGSVEPAVWCHPGPTFGISCKRKARSLGSTFPTALAFLGEENMNMNSFLDYTICETHSTAFLACKCNALLLEALFHPTRNSEYLKFDFSFHDNTIFDVYSTGF